MLLLLEIMNFVIPALVRN